MIDKVEVRSPSLADLLISALRLPDPLRNIVLTAAGAYVVFQLGRCAESYRAMKSLPVDPLE